MRENMGLYRGKREDNGEWIEGYYFERKDTHGNIIESIIIVDAYEQITGSQRYLRSNLGYESFRVDPKTVGEYTGLPDKNGKGIFEGDIVRTERDLWSGETKKEREEFVSVVRYDNKLCCFGLSGKYKHLPLNRFKGDYNEVIGNIHDNPELLEVSAND